jgi:ubiquinone biosynthesis protein UbiJ
LKLNEWKTADGGMAELTVELLRTELEAFRIALVELVRSEVGTVRSEVGTVRSEVDSLSGRVDRIGSEVGKLSERVDRIGSELVTVRVRVDGLPIIGNSIDVVQRDMRLLRAAINDMARTNITAGEVEAMHEDLDRALAKQAELEARVAALEQRKD